MSQQINLYESRLRPRHELATARNLGVMALLFVLLMTGLALWGRADAERKTAAAEMSGKLQGEEQEKLVAVSKLIAERKVSPALAEEIELAKATLAERKEIVDALDSGKLGNVSGFSAFLSGFARQTQSDLWLTGFSINQGGEEIEIRGRTLDPARLTAYVHGLSGEAVFKGRRFAALEMRDVEPEALTPDQPGTAKATTAGAAPQLKLPRFSEFVLRSENADGKGGLARSGVKP